jgi:hypothetical protein
MLFSHYLHNRTIPTLKNYIFAIFYKGNELTVKLIVSDDKRECGMARPCDVDVAEAVRQTRNAGQCKDASTIWLQDIQITNPTSLIQRHRIIGELLRQGSYKSILSN